MTPWAAKWAACWLDPHWRSTVVPGNGLRPAGCEHCVAGDVDRLLPDLHHAAHHHVVDETGIDVVAIDEGFQRLGGEIHRMPVAELAVALAQRRAHGVDDHRSSHGANGTRDGSTGTHAEHRHSVAGATLPRTA